MDGPLAKSSPVSIFANKVLPAHLFLYCLQLLSCCSELSSCNREFMSRKIKYIYSLALHRTLLFLD